MTLPIACLVSGGGTTLQNLLDRTASGRLDAEVVRVVADRPAIRALERAEEAGVPTTVVSPEGGPDALGERIAGALDDGPARLICMAGFLRLWTIPEAWRERVLNIHPSLLPAFGGEGFYGRRVHEAVLARGCKITGCTVHFADDVYDHGPIVCQRPVPILEDDDPDSLARRVFVAECELYPKAIRLFAGDRLRLVDAPASDLVDPPHRRVRILPA